MKNIYKVNGEAVKKIAERVYDNGSTVINRNDLEEMFPELKESEDEKIRKALIEFHTSTININGISGEKIVAYLKKHGEHSAKNIVEAWKDMRLEVYQQASGNRHEPNYSDDNTKMFSLNDIDEIIEKISEQKLARMVSRSLLSEEDEAILSNAIYYLEEYRRSNLCKNESDMQNAAACEDWLQAFKDGTTKQ